MRPVSAMARTLLCTALCARMGLGWAADTPTQGREGSEIVAVAPEARLRQREWLFSAAMRSDYVETAGVASSNSSVALTGQLRLRSRTRPDSMAVLIERAFVDGREDTTLFGVLFSRDFGRWSASVAPYLYKRGAHAAQWRQQSTARYRLGARSAVGIELIGPLDELGSSKLLAGLYTKRSEYLSAAVTLGRGLRAGPDLALRVAVTWRVK